MDINKLIKVTDNLPYKVPQQGFALIVALAVLSIVTLLVLAMMSDNTLQLAMVRNSQLQAQVYHRNLSEINTQLDRMQTDASYSAALITELLKVEKIQTQSFFTRSTKPQPMLDVTNFDQNLQLIEPKADITVPAEGLSLSQKINVAWMLMELDNQVTISNRSESSKQVQGLRYLRASN